MGHICTVSRKKKVLTSVNGQRRTRSSLIGNKGGVHRDRRFANRVFSATWLHLHWCTACMLEERAVAPPRLCAFVAPSQEPELLFCHQYGGFVVGPKTIDFYQPRHTREKRG